MKYVLIILLLALSSSVQAQDKVIFKCLDSDGINQYTMDTPPIAGLTNCKGMGITSSSEWVWLGSYGNEGDVEVWKYKFFDVKRPADKLWVNVFELDDKPLEPSTFLYSFKCATKQLQILQYSTTDGTGNVKTYTQPSSLRYANPGTTDESLLKIACKKPTK